MSENFYLDNPDLRFHMEQMVDWERLVELKEDLGSEECPYSSAADATEMYLQMLRNVVGELAGGKIAPRAKAVDEKGCTYHDGEVEFPPELKQNIADLSEAGLTGVTYERKYGGMFLPRTFYSAATEIISPAYSRDSSSGSLPSSVYRMSAPSLGQLNATYWGAK